MRPSYSPRTVQYIGGAAENMQFDRKQRCHSDENAICHNTANLYTKSPRDQPICTTSQPCTATENRQSTNETRDLEGINKEHDKQNGETNEHIESAPAGWVSPCRSRTR